MFMVNVSLLDSSRSEKGENGIEDVLAIIIVDLAFLESHDFPPVNFTWCSCWQY